MDQQQSGAGGPTPSGDTIANWSPTQLVLVIKDILTRDPPQVIDSLTVDQLTAATNLYVRDQITFVRDPIFHVVGKSGEPAFANSWVNFGNPSQGAGFWKDPFGVVHLRGKIKSGTVGSVAFTLPPGYRVILNADEDFPVISNAAVGLVSVASDGTVTPKSPSNNTYVSLSGISFRTT